MRRVLIGLVTVLALAAGCGSAVDKRSYIRQLTFLCGQTNLALADVDPGEEPARFANQFTQLLAQIRGMEAPEDDGAVLRRLVASFEQTRDRFLAAQEAQGRGDEAVAVAEADAAIDRLEQTSDIATEYGMPPLTECDETATLAPAAPADGPSDDTSPPPGDAAQTEIAPSAGPTETATGWQRAADLDLARQQFAGADVDGAVYVTGGLLRRRATRRVDVLDQTLGQWRSAPRLPVALHHHMAVAHDGALVVLGGWQFDGQDPTGRVSDRVFVLRSGASAWDELPRLRRPRAAGAAAVVGDEIIVVGGQNANGLVGPIEVFDGRSWRDAESIPTRREHVAAASDGRFVYAAGGRNISPTTNMATLERYDPRRDRWSTLPSMPTARGSMHAAVIDDRLVVVGGEGPRSELAVVEAYDIVSRTWTTFPPLDVARHGAEVIASGGRLYAIGGAEGIGHTRSSRVVEVLDPPARQRQPTSWEPGTSAPAPRQQAAVARVNGVLWMVGGLDGGNAPTARVEGLDPPFGFWREIDDPLPEPMHHAMAVNLGGRLVVLGGFAEADGRPAGVASNVVYEWREDGWHRLPPMHNARAAGIAGVVDGQIVVAGGQDGRGLVTPTEIYDPQEQAWRIGADIRTPREHLAGGVHDGYLYAAGGRDMGPERNVASFERYDIEADRWEALEPMPTPRGSIGGAVVQERLAVVGGESPTTVLDTVELYDFAAGTWSTGPSLQTPRHGASAGARGPSLYVMGGAERTLHRGSLASVEVLRFR